ncbi:zinc-binding metallopeptidase family protein [Achromobacter aloeverae]
MAFAPKQASDHAGVAPATPRAYLCICGRRVFFGNTQCLYCKAPLGYVPSRCGLYALAPGAEPDTWRIAEDMEATGTLYRRCGNFDSPAACDWLIEPQDHPRHQLCRACRLNRVIPNLSSAENRELWLKIESAKRRLVSQLIGLGLPVASKVSEDPEHGLAYDFLRNEPGKPRVMTGHANGIITINLEEADDAVRERTRVEMGEPYRTLLGHFRHEVGHYYWERLVKGTSYVEPYRALFGDEREDYAAALKKNYEEGPPADWPIRFVSAYASVHSFEDWAETWAHYLHLRDTLDTADSYGIGFAPDDAEAPSFGTSDLWQPDAPNGKPFLEMLDRWIRVTSVMNEMSRAMGLPDFYPFVLPRAAVAKLHFIHCIVSESSSPAAPASQP